ncbi:hypothetical protein FRB98_009698 [Tulasnella sp. 332]|nr:hypothetical protein FRB98_009698 [Tulasnella sp. 332]
MCVVRAESEHRLFNNDGSKHNKRGSLNILTGTHFAEGETSCDYDTKALEDEDLAVYTWGEDSYDGLGDALDERGDTFNDETFGGEEPIGKDFDFTSQLQALPSKQPPAQTIPLSSPSPKALEPTATKQQSRHVPQNGHNPDTSGSNSLEALWQQPAPSMGYQQLHLGHQSPMQDYRSPVVGHARSYAPAKFSPFDDTGSQPTPKSRPRTLQDIEAELRRQHAVISTHQPHGVPQPKQQNDYYEPSNRQMNQMIPNEMAPYAAPDGGSLTMNDVQRMLQAQHISEPPYHQPMMSQQQLQQQQYREQMIQLQMLQAQQQQLQQQRQLYQQQQQPQATAAMQHALEQQMLLGETARHIGGANVEHLVRNERQVLREPRVPHQAMRSVDHTPGTSAMLDQEQRSLLMGEATRKIMEAEMMEEKRRRRAAKIARMAKHNDLMTQSDKDFITRIQVSQLVTNDPYAEDFYAQVFSSFVRSRLGGPEGGQKSMLKFANGAGVGTGVPGHRGAGRRENAMARMQAQVEKMISNARAREHGKSSGTVNPALQGALGNVSGRSNKAAPRQMLQVSSNGATASPSFAAALPVRTHEEHHRVAQAAGKLGREAMNVDPSDTVTRKAPLTHRQAQIAVESIYDSLLAIEQMNRDAPPGDDIESRGIWLVNICLKTESILKTYFQGRRPYFFGRGDVVQIDDNGASGNKMDVVREAHVLDDLQGPTSARWKQVSGETDAALIMLPSIISVLGTASLRLLTGLLNIMMGNGLLAVLQIVKSQPGILLLTAFMSRVDQLKHEDNSGTGDDWVKWQSAFENFVNLLHGNITSLFPSRRLASAAASHPIPNIDLADQIVWQFLAALSAIGTQQQQMSVVAEVREMILQNVQAVHNGWVVDQDEAALKLANVDILLRAIGLDHTMLIAPS